MHLGHRLRVGAEERLIAPSRELKPEPTQSSPFAGASRVGFVAGSSR
jgi:hypothetical protein